MAEQIRDAIRHLEKDMADILDIMLDKLTTEVILNPYRRPNGIYEGHILVEQHGTGICNLMRYNEVIVDKVVLNISDTVLYKHALDDPNHILFWVKLQPQDIYKQFAHCIRSQFDTTNKIIQSSNFSLLEFAQNLEDGYINGTVSSLDPTTLVQQVNMNLSASFLLGYKVITDTDIKMFRAYPSFLIKSEIVKMTATKAETIMSVLASITGKFIHSKSPYLECQIPKYGHRFTGTIMPATNFPAFCIRKHAPRVYTLNDFVAQKVMQQTSCDTIRSWIKRKLNILIAGGTGSGKTTLANAILHEINQFFPQERVLIIEDVPELQFNTSRSLAFTVGEFFSMQEALRTTLRFKPDRIVMGEVRGSEAYTLLKAWNTGHPGGVATIHANGVDSALARFESCVRDHPDITINRQELGFTINGIISIQNITVKEEQNGQYINVVKRKVTALRQIMQYDPDKDIYQDIVYDRVEESFD